MWQPSGTDVPRISSVRASRQNGAPLKVVFLGAEDSIDVADAESLIHADHAP
jgi:hypothetical protein